MLAVTVLVVLGGAALQETETNPRIQHVPPPVARPAPPPPPPPAGPPVLAVKIDNAPAARPPTGIGAADLVYVEPVEAGISRIMAVFASDRPEVIGPVRSARETDLGLLAQFGHPTLAFSGAAPELLPSIDQAAVENGSQESVPSAYYRGNTGKPPHNLFARADELPPGSPWSPNAPLAFGPPPAGGTPSTHHEVDYPNASMDFQWSPEERRWLVSFDGSPYVATDSGRLAPSTVVVQKVPVADSDLSDSAGNVSPHAETVGSGQALVLRDGLAFEVNWSRPAPDAGTTYTTLAGDPVPFAPGQVWTVLDPV